MFHDFVKDPIALFISGFIDLCNIDFLDWDWGRDAETSCALAQHQVDRYVIQVLVYCKIPTKDNFGDKRVCNSVRKYVVYAARPTLTRLEGSTNAMQSLGGRGNTGSPTISNHVNESSVPDRRG